MEMTLRRLSVLGLAFALTLLGPSVGARAATPPALTSMASLGDSITRAYNTGPSSFVDYPANSWATGTTTSVNSHYLRLRAVAPSMVAFNDAVSGAKVANLAAQVGTANAQQVDYVTILIGGNDVCTSSEASMTSVAAFRSSLDAALSALGAVSPNASVYVLSIPDVYNLWSILKNNGSARFVWALFRICQSMLVRPLSTLPADVQRRANVSQRNKDFNEQLRQACAAYVPVGKCRYDGGATFNTKFVAADVSTRDYFHPSLAGQTKLAAVSWAAGYWGP